MNNNVLIIGNGFDLYHRLPTRYTDFLFLVKNWEDFYSLYTEQLVKVSGTENIAEHEQFNVSVDEYGKLTKEALTDFANHATCIDNESISVLAAFYMLSAEALYKAGAIIMLVGMGMHALLPPAKILVTLAICMYSFGEHIQIGMKNTLSLKYAKPGCGGAALGVQNATSQIGTLAGYLLIVVAFSLFAHMQPYKLFFWLATILAAASVLFSLRITGKSHTDASKRRFYFHKKYSKYYMLEMFYGARKQVFLTFGPYVLILFYGASAATVSLLFAVSAVACFFASPLVGRIVDRLGYKVVMVADTLILVIVCFFYGFAHHLFPGNVAFIVCCVNYVLDAVISLASMASNLYVQELSDNADEVKATISTGVSINHVITIFIALFGGWIWQTLGIELLFITSAVLGLCNSAYAATIKTETESSV